jgi:hypothetical protein
VDEPDSTCESCGLTASDSGNDVVLINDEVGAVVKKLIELAS